VRQRGAIPISLILYGLAAAAVAGALWWVVDEWRDGRAAQREVAAAMKECPPAVENVLDCVRAEQATQRAIQAKFDAFVSDHKRLGLEAQKRAEAEKERQAQVNRERTAGYEKRLASINDAYRRLRDGRADTRGGGLSSVPDATRPPDDTARDQRLLEVLRNADEQTARLIELQRWVGEQAKVKP
jgi:hypothetical protein